MSTSVCNSKKDLPRQDQQLAVVSTTTLIVRKLSSSNMAISNSNTLCTYLKVVIFITAIMLFTRTIDVITHRPRRVRTVEEDAEKQLIKSEKELQSFVHNIDMFHELKENVRDDITVESNLPPISKKYRTSKYVSWETAKSHMIRYNFNETDEPIPKTKGAQKFGRVKIQHNSSVPLSNSNKTMELSDNIYIAPADFICRHQRQSTDTLATVAMATTMFFQGEHSFMLHNTIKNWSRLKPFVQPVMYVTPSEKQKAHAMYAIENACHLGWDVYVAPEVNRHNFPVLRSMMVDMIDKYSTPIVGYANGDILFDDSMPDTLQFFVKNNKHFVNKKQHLITGRRKDIQLKQGAMLNRVKSVNLLGQRNTFHGTLGFDYFFSARNGYHWDSIPPFVIGRPVFDNYLVWQAIQRKGEITCLDASYSITALHQGIKGMATGWKHRDVDQKYNMNMVNPFSVRHGNTDCISRKLTRLDNGRYQVKQAHIKTNGIIGCRAYLAIVLYEGRNT